MCDQSTIVPAEEWRIIPGYEGWYSVSSLGRVRRDRQGKGTRVGHIHTPYPNREGYLFVCLSVHGKTRRVAAHILVALAFLGPIPDGLEIDHRDTDPANNAASNLEYVTHPNNVHRAVATRIVRTGKPSPNTHLTADDVRAIRASTDSQRIIGLRYGIEQASVSHIRRYKRWGHLR